MSVNDGEQLQDINAMWDSASVMTDQMLKQWAENEKLASGRHLKPRKPGRSSIFVPKIPSYIKRKLADFISQFVGDDPISIKHTVTSDPIGAKIRQKVHNHYVRSMNYESVIYNASYSGLVYNYAPIILDWQEITESKKIIQQTGMPDGSVVEEEVEVETIVESNPIAYVVPPEDVRVDSAVAWNEVDNSRYFGYRMFISESDADVMVKSGKWPKIESEHMVNPNRMNILGNERKTAVSPFEKNSIIDIDNGILEIRYHFHFKETKNGFEPVRSVTLGDIQILEDCEPMEINWGGNKHAWPITIGEVHPKPFEQHAPALPEQGKDLQIEVNAIRNQRRDNVSLILNPEKYVTPHAGVTPAQLAFSFPGKVVSVENLNGIQWQTVPDVTSSGHNEESRVESDMDRMFSEAAIRQGVPGPRKESATAIQVMSSNASASTGLDVRMFMISAIRPLHEKLGNAIAQKAPEELFIRAAMELDVNMENGFDAYIAANEGEFIYNVYASSQQNDIANIISNNSNIMGIIQTAYGPNANYKPLVDSILETAGYDPDTIIPQPAFSSTMANQAMSDPGGMVPGGKPSIQPRAQFQGGGAMDEGSGEQ